MFTEIFAIVSTEIKAIITDVIASVGLCGYCGAMKRHGGACGGCGN